MPSDGRPCTTLHGDSERERHAAETAAHGRMAWQRRHRYGKRYLTETATSLTKRVNGRRLTTRSFGARQNETAIHIKNGNRDMTIARPASIRVQ
jgi:hypothetical protein